MSDNTDLAALIELASAVATAATQPMAESAETSGRKAGEHRALYRGSVRGYLEQLASFLASAGVPSEGAQPVHLIVEQLSAIDDFAAEPPLFQAGGMPFGLTKPIARLAAEGHAVGCAVYLHEKLGLKRMLSCNTIASLFSGVGHAGRIREHLHADRRSAGKLSGKTIYQWYNELELRPDGAGMGWAIRRMARDLALDALANMECNDPTDALPKEEARTKLAIRIATIAVGTRIGAPGEPKVVWQQKSESTP